MFNEPPIQPDDTRPTQTFPAVQLNPGIPLWQRILGFGMLIAAVGLLAATVMVISTPVEQTVIVVTSTPTTETVAEIATETPTDQPLIIETTANEILPTLSFEARSSLLATPVIPIAISNDLQVIHNNLEPFTIIPDRPRNRVEQYIIQKGDTINGIAERFGLTQETIAWSNDRREIWVLTPGAKLNILPVNGVYHQAVGSATIREIAAQYKVTDPMIVIDSEYNNLRSLAPDSVPPSGLWIVIPGGVADEINWSPTVQTTGGGGGGAGDGSGLVSFDPSSPGSCGAQSPGIASGWDRPLNFYTFMRGFSSFHTGVDLAASPGTPVMAASSGRVIFAGRSNWGYGILVVISHGAFSTLYGHLSSENVSCGELVGQGQVIGAVGSTGNSSGPHLHFEIQYSGVATNPTEIMPF